MYHSITSRKTVFRNRNFGCKRTTNGQQLLNNFEEIKFNYKENKIVLIKNNNKIVIPRPEIQEHKSTIEERDIEAESVYTITTQQQQQIKDTFKHINKPNSRKERK